MESVAPGETNISLDDLERNAFADILPTRQEEAPSPKAAKGPSSLSAPPVNRTRNLLIKRRCPRALVRDF